MAEFIIDLGPDGGKLIAKGSPEEIINMNSYIAEYLKKVLNI